jgi:hypothetical protein
MVGGSRNVEDSNESDWKSNHRREYSCEGTVEENRRRRPSSYLVAWHVIVSQSKIGGGASRTYSGKYVPWLGNGRAT